MAVVEKNEGNFNSLSGTNVLMNSAKPAMALKFNGRPPTSKLISANVIVKNKTAIISGLNINAYAKRAAPIMIMKVKSKRAYFEVMSACVELIFPSYLF
jgi:hypothetical protein